MKNNQSAFFSVIIPVYKVENYLEECVESVLRQNFPDIEVILVDDGSPDNCPEICDKYAHQDSRVHVIHQKNGGLSVARNAGLRRAQGKYILFLDSDDYYLSDSFLLSAHRRAVETDADIIFHRRRKYDEASDTMQNEPAPYSEEITVEKDAGRLYKLLEQKGQLDASAALKVIRRKFLLENGLYFEEGLLSEDVEWFFRVSRCVQKAAVLNHSAYCYRLREGSITHTIGKKHIMDLVYMVSKHAKWLKDEPRTDLIAGLLSYLSYQYYITLGLFNVYASDEKQKLEQFRMEHKWLTKYGISRKTQMAGLAVKYGGCIAPMILGKYIIHR